MICFVKMDVLSVLNVEFMWMLGGGLDAKECVALVIMHIERMMVIDGEDNN